MVGGLKEMFSCSAQKEKPGTGVLTLLNLLWSTRSSSGTKRKYSQGNQKEEEYFKQLKHLLPTESRCDRKIDH
jgi:hypothetical protein